VRTVSSGLTLEALAADINARLTKSDGYLESAAIHLREAKDRVEAGEAGDDTFEEWCRANIRTKAGHYRSFPEIQRLLSYASGDASAVAEKVAKRREQKREAVRRVRAKSGLRSPELPAVVPVPPLSMELADVIDDPSADGDTAPSDAGEVLQRMMDAYFTAAIKSAEQFLSAQKAKGADAKLAHELETWVQVFRNRGPLSTATLESIMARAGDHAAYALMGRHTIDYFTALKELERQPAPPPKAAKRRRKMPSAVVTDTNADGVAVGPVDPDDMPAFLKRPQPTPEHA
jgi:hypothetical protein